MRAELEPVGTEWINVQTFFSDDTAMGEFLAFEQSRYARMDIKTAGAFLMNDYAYIFAATTVPLFFGFGLIPELAPASVALSFDTKKQVHDGKIYPSRRAHMGFDEAGILYGRLDEDLLGSGSRSISTSSSIGFMQKQSFHALLFGDWSATRLLNAFWMPACGSTQSRLQMPQRCAS